MLKRNSRISDRVCREIAILKAGQIHCQVAKEGAGEHLNPRPRAVPFGECDPASNGALISHYLSFILGSPNNVHVRRISGSRIADLARMVKSPKLALTVRSNSNRYNC